MVDFDVTVVAAVCDCSLISWDEPGNIPDLLDALVGYEASITVKEAGPNQDSLVATSGARACSSDIDCDYAYTVTPRLLGGDPLPEWMEYQ